MLPLFANAPNADVYVLMSAVMNALGIWQVSEMLPGLFMAPHYNAQFASAHYNAPYHYGALRLDHKLELQLQTSIWETGEDLLAAQQTQTGEPRASCGSRAGW